MSHATDCADNDCPGGCTTAASKVQDRMATMESERFSARVSGIVVRLRALADDVERLVTPRKNLRDLTVDHSATASEIIHILTWGAANLGIEHLVDTATDADRLLRDQT